MTMQSQIQTLLHNELQPYFFEVANESHMHNVPPDSESHFKIVLVSNQFEGLSLLKRHQLVYEVLKNEMKQGIHALALHTLTADEYAKRHGAIPDSPLCQGGSKAT